MESASNRRNTPVGIDLPHRRAFLRRAAASGVVFGLSLAASACTVPVRSYRARRRDGARISRREYPELRRDGGTVKVFAGDLPVYVRHEGGDRYTALSGICTHLGCTVEATRRGFRCPCHGSTYDREGEVTGGPAPSPLERYTARLDASADAVVLELRREEPLEDA